MAVVILSGHPAGNIPDKDLWGLHFRCFHPLRLIALMQYWRNFGLCNSDFGEAAPSGSSCFWFLPPLVWLLWRGGPYMAGTYCSPVLSTAVRVPFPGRWGRLRVTRGASGSVFALPRVW